MSDSFVRVEWRTPADGAWMPGRQPARPAEASPTARSRSTPSAAVPHGTAVWAWRQCPSGFSDQEQLQEASGSRICQSTPIERRRGRQSTRWSNGHGAARTRAHRWEWCRLRMVLSRSIKKEHYAGLRRNGRPTMVRVTALSAPHHDRHGTLPVPVAAFVRAVPLPESRSCRRPTFCPI